MTPSEDLFDLIRSLTQNEKRYFKINASKHIIGEKNNYVRLFEVIDKQKKYDEAAIKKYFRNEVFIRQMTFTKNYLYNLILKSLNGYHSELSVDIELKELFKNIEILYAKSLHKQCGKLLEKAKKLAYSYEKHLEILEVLKWEKILLTLLRSDRDHIKKIRENYHAENERILNEFKSVRKYEKISDAIFYTIQEGGRIRNENKLKILDKIFQKELLNVDDTALGFDAKKFLYSSFNLYFTEIQDLQKNYLYSRKAVGLMESFPKQIARQPGNYIVALNNMIICCINLKQYDEAITTIIKMRVTALDFPANEELNKHIFETSYSLELSIYQESGNFEKGIPLVKKIESGLNSYKISELYKVLLQLQIANLYFGTGKYNEALKWLNKIIHSSTLELRPDVLCHSRIFNLIIHFELGNKDFLEYTVISTYRFLYKRERLYKFETIILNFIRKSAKANTSKELIDLFKKLRSELLPLEKDPFEKKVLEHFDFISWLDSKIEKRNFADCVRQRQICQVKDKIAKKK
jgi:hypothetical protein